MNSWVSCKRYLPERTFRSFRTVIALALAILCSVPGPALAQDVCGEFAVATAPQQVGQPLSDDIISLTSSSGEVGRASFEEPQVVEPTPRPGIALVRSLGGNLALLDVETETIIPLRIPENEQPQLSATLPSFRNAPKSDFMLLSSGPTGVWLVDLSSGDALNLATLNDDGPPFIESASVSPDGTWVLFSSGDTARLISLEVPGDLQDVDNDPILPFPSFDANSEVIYGVGGDGDSTIRRLDPASGVRTNIVDAPGVRVLPLQNADPLLMLDGRHVLALLPGADEPSFVFQWTGNPIAVLSNIMGSHLLVGDEVSDSTHWHWVEVGTGASVALPQLDGMSPLSTSTNRDFVTFVPTVRIGPGVIGAQYRTFEMSTGTVTTVLEQDSDDIYQARPAGDAAGRYTIVNALSPGTGRIWLIDNRLGTAALVATSPGNADARVSPDGCQLAVAIFTTVGEGRTSKVTVTSLVDGTLQQSIPDALLLGWAAYAAPS